MRIRILFGFICLFCVSSCYNQNVALNEFPLGYEEGKVEIPVVQLKSYPLPRYAYNHKLLRNYNWVSSLHYLGGLPKDTTLSQEQKVANVVEIQKELTLHWNYYLHLGNSKKLAKAKMKNVKTDAYSAFIQLANENPEIPVSITTFWLGGNLKEIGESKGRAFAHRKDLPDSMFIQNYKTPFGHPVISFAAPDSLLKIDGLVQRHYFNEISKKLTRPINIINENGEVRPFVPISKSILKKDNRLKLDFESSGSKNWGVYQAKNKLRFRRAFKNSFFNDSPLIDSSTIFSWYGLDGNSRSRFNWNISKKIMTPHQSRYYSTGDFYPRWSSNWKKGKGAWHGWNWVKKARRSELKSGDLLFSPFVAAGWDSRPDKNIRPGQWLSLLKHLSVIGAEFFYTGFFNMDQPTPNPENYFWQLAMPAYAQAVTSRYENILRNGDVLKNTEGEYIFEIPTNNQNAIVSIRKHDTKPVYIIVGSLQPSTLFGLESLNDKEKIEITFDSFEIEIEVRKQGSVYYADFSDTEKPIFFQLDQWHEEGHPSHWSKEIIIEAENFDLAENVEIQTTAKVKNDFSNFETKVSLKDNSSSLIYFCNCKKGRSYKIGFDAKTGKKKKLSGGEVLVNGKEGNLSKFVCPETGQLKLEIRNFKKAVQIDRIIIKPSL